MVNHIKRLLLNITFHLAILTGIKVDHGALLLVAAGIHVRLSPVENIICQQIFHNTLNF